MTYYYIHPESGSAFADENPPDVVCSDGLVQEVFLEEYLRACAEWGITPEVDPVDLLFGDLV